MTKINAAQVCRHSSASNQLTRHFTAHSFTKEHLKYSEHLPGLRTSGLEYVIQ